MTASLVRYRAVCQIIEGSMYAGGRPRLLQTRGSLVYAQRPRGFWRSQSVHASRRLIPVRAWLGSLDNM